MIKKWKKESLHCMPEEISKEYVKYLLPHAHSTRYSFYASFDDLQYIINLRTRRGGHIAYRVLVYRWLELLNIQDGIWYSLHRGIEKPNPKSKQQFVDRS